MAELGVNIDHVATVRQARRTTEPDPVWAATLAQLGGADGITLHLREDRRHIQDRDLRILRETVTVKLNLELACNPDVVELHTGEYALATGDERQKAELDKLLAAGRQVVDAGLTLHAGHGLTYR